ncbi:MAG: PilN domain-containing protein [Candidatus Binataceae bacterium]|nr:PilN domain-containing protein [Candidatus Binataceae bacterium]
MGQRILALELAGDQVRGAMAESTWNTLELVGAWQQQRGADEPDLAAAIARLVVVAGQPDLVVSALPGEYVAKRLLALPFRDRRRLQQVVPFALEEHLPFPVDDAAVAFARVGRDDDKTLVIAAFARKRDLVSHLEMLGRAGLDPHTVTLGALALAGLLARARNGHATAHLVLDIDHASTSMVLIDASGTPRAMRTVGQGISGHNGKPLAPLAAAAIVGAVRQTLLAHGSEGEAPELVLTGPAAATPALREQIGNALAVPIHDVDEFDCSSFFTGDRSVSLRFAACLAMLLGEAPNKPLELLNFRAGEFAYHGRTGVTAPLRLSAALAATAVGMALLHFILSLSIGARQLHLLDDHIAAIAAPALGNADPSTAKAALNEKILVMRKRLNLMGGNLGHGSPLDVLLDLSRAVPAGLPMQVNDLTIDDGGLKIEGTADSFATVDQVKKALERAADLGVIQVDHAAAGADPSKIEFRLSASLKGGGSDAD